MTPTLLLSPRIAALFAEIDAGNAAALDGFWRDVERGGAPLVESASVDGYWLVTFVYRGTEKTQNVALLSSIGGMEARRNLLARFRDTDLWLRTYLLAEDVRTVYQFSVDDPLIDVGALDHQAQQVYQQSQEARAQTDPFNAKVCDVGFGLPARSIVELPAAPVQAWAEERPHVPKGTVETHPMESRMLGNARAVWVYTPPGYTSSAAPYPLLLLFDGYAYAYTLSGPATYDNLIAAGRVPPLVVAMIHHPDRYVELACNAAYADFLVQEFLPWLQARYHVTGAPQHTIVGGLSYGGLAAAFVALRHPQRFGHVLSQSGCFWWKPPGEREWEWMTRRYVEAPRVPVRFYLEVGRLEAWVVPLGFPDALTANRHLRDVLRAKGYDLEYKEFNGGHDFICWRGTLAEGLVALAGGS